MILKAFLDFTKSRPLTFYEGEERGVIHIAMDAPYCPNLQMKFREHAKNKGLAVKGDVTDHDIKGIVEGNKALIAETFMAIFTQKRHFLRITANAMLP